MDKGGFIFLIVICLLVFGMLTYCGLLVTTALPAEDNVVIDGDDVGSYNIDNADRIEIVMDDGVVYDVKLGYYDDVIDFTVNSDIHIELERFDTRLFWWDFIITPEPIFPDEYRIGRIIKIPNAEEG